MAGKKTDLIKIWEGESQVVVNHVDDCFVIWETAETTSIKVVTDLQLAAARKTTPTAPNLRLVPAATLLTCAEGETITDVDFVRGSIVLYMQRLNTPLLRVLRYAGALSQPDDRRLTIADAVLPFKIGVISAGTNENYSADSVVFYVSAPFVYEEAYSYHLQSGTVSVLQKY